MIKGSSKASEKGKIPEAQAIMEGSKEITKAAFNPKARTAKKSTALTNVPEINCILNKGAKTAKVKNIVKKILFSLSLAICINSP